MTVKDAEGAYDYSCWANRRLFDVISGLSVEEFTRPVAGSYGSVRNTLVHILSAEAGWLERCGGPQRGPRFNADDFPTFESVLVKWTSVEAQWREFLATRTEDALAGIVEFTVASSAKYAMPLGQLVLQTTTHGVHHRGQVALLLRLLGRTPGDFDILYYFAERRGPGLN